MLETKERQTPVASSTSDTALQHSHARSSTYWQFLRYCLVGGVNTLLDLLVLNVLLWGFPTKNVLILVAYNSVAYSGGAVTSFFLNKYWTFGYKRQTTRREVVRFSIILALEILYSNGLVWLAGKVLQHLITNPTLWGDVSKLVALSCGAVLSYAFMRFWTFASRSQDQPNQQELLQQNVPEPPPMVTSNTTEYAHHSWRTKEGDDSKE